MSFNAKWHKIMSIFVIYGIYYFTSLIFVCSYVNEHSFTLIMLKLYISVFENSVDPDQLAS